MTDQNRGEPLSRDPVRSRIGNPSGFRTSISKWIAGIGLTAVAASASTFVPNYLTYEYYPQTLQDDGITYSPLLQDVEAGTAGSPSTTGAVVGADKGGYISTFESASNFSANYINRIYGYFIPPVTGNYVFFVASDDNSDLFLSTDATPANKHLIAQEGGYSPVRSYTAIGGTPSDPAEKRSDTFSASQWPGGGATINLTKGQKYYIEADHHEGGGGDNLAVTYKLASDPDPKNGSAPLLGGPVIGTDFSSTPSTAPNLAITTQPLGGTYYIGGTLNLTAVLQSDSSYPISYQWTKNGTNIPGANSATFAVAAPAATDAGTYVLTASVPGLGGNLVSVTSSNAVVTIQTAPLVTGKLKYLYFPGAGSLGAVESGTLTPSYAGSIVGSDLSGLITSAEAGSGFADSYGNQISGFFIPPADGDYIFFICSDDQSDLWLSTDSDPANKKLIARETVWSNPRQWNTSGGSSDLTAKRSDQFATTQWPNGNTIHLLGGTKYYLEADHIEGNGGDNLGVTYALATEDPSLTADGTASRLTGTNIGVYVPPVITFTGVSPTYKALSFGIQDVSPSILDPSSIKVTFDGQDIAPTVSPKGTNGITSFTYSFPTNLAQGSTHNYSIVAKDASGNTINSIASFTVPTQLFPKGDLPGPAPAGTNWATRFIFNAGTMTDDPTAMKAILAASSNGFTGTIVDIITNVINYNNGGNGGIFTPDNPYPDAVTSDANWTGDNFISLSIGNLVIPEESDYTFGTHTDDGFALRIRGGQVVSVSGAGQADPVDPETVFESAPTGNSDTRAVYHLKKGVYRIEYFWYEDGGGDAGELYAAKGAFVKDADTSAWRLVGDTTPSQTLTLLGVDSNGWSVVASDPGGDVIDSWAAAQNDFATFGSPKTYDYLNVGDPDTNPGVLAFPKDTVGKDDDYYTMKATATLVVPQDGTYLLGFDSDDGAYMKVAGQTFIDIQQNNTGLSVVGGDTVTCDCLTGDSGTTATITLEKGNYQIEVGEFEDTGGSFIAARGVLLPANPVTTSDMPFLAKGAAGSTTNTVVALQLTSAAPDGGNGGGGNTNGPSATFTFSNGSLTINSTAGGTVQATDTLSSPNWQDIGSAPQTVAVSSSSKSRFFRIKQ